MAGPDVSELIDLLVRRGPLLRRISAESGDKATLAETGDVSRSTVDRGIRELERDGLVERTDGGYRPTVAGRLALRLYGSFVDGAEGVVESLPALEDLPSDAPLDPAVLRGADVAVASHPDPERPTRVQRDLLDRATHQRSLAPTVLPQHVDVYYDEIASGDLSGEFVVTPSALERLVRNHADRLGAAVEGDAVTIRETESLPPYGLSVTETGSGPVVGLLVFSDAGVSGFLTTDDPAAVAWARSLFERHWEDARPIDP